VRPWEKGKDPVSIALVRMDAAFEFFTKMQAPFYAFHDRDIAPEGRSLAESNRNLDKIVAHAKQLQKATGVKLLWGTANLFSNPRYMNGAATNPDAHVFAYAAAQVKKALEVTKTLGGENYVFWGGREGYETLLNTDLKREQAHLAAFLHMAVDYAREIGFTGQFLIEPKPKEPTKHQYDFDVASGIAFLRTFGLEKHFKFNIETNHATLAGHTFQHEIEVAASVGLLGSIDANAGDPLLGWDTDQFNTDVKELTLAMLSILKAGGIGSFSTPTSAAWTPTPSPSNSPTKSAPTANSPISSRPATPASTPTTAAPSRNAKPTSATSKNSSSKSSANRSSAAATRSTSRIS
jgi:xylose isomerase